MGSLRRGPEAWSSSAGCGLLGPEDECVARANERGASKKLMRAGRPVERDAEGPVVNGAARG